MLNRQQLCAALSISESTVRRLEQIGLPYVPVGARSHRYDLDECKEWLRVNGAFAPRAVPDRRLAELEKRARNLQRRAAT